MQLQGQYERHEVWVAFERKSGSKQWPSTDPKDSPFDTFKCRHCGAEFRLQMYGASMINEPTFDDKALILLTEHLNIKHPRRKAIIDDPFSDAEKKDFMEEP